MDIIIELKGKYYFCRTICEDSETNVDIMKLYHYTTTESLALILKNKSLLFNRLDCVDDIEEGSVMSCGIMVGRYVFVSCWTESAEESIPLWKMYGGGDKMGVRIGLEKEMFRRYHIVNPKIGNQQWYGEMDLPLSLEELNAPDYFVLPIFQMDEDYFYRKIQYVDNVSDKTNDAVTITPPQNEKGETQINIKFGEIGRYKHKRWEFQNETRFVVTIFPYNPNLAPPEKVGTIAINTYIQNKTVNFTKYFLPLDERALRNIEITLSPNATDGQRVLVESLIREYAPEAKIKNSSLGKLVRM